MRTWLALLGGLLLWAGHFFALYLIVAGFERFMIEFLRRNTDAALGLTQAQLTSVVMIAVGAVWVVAVAGRGQLREPTPPRFA